MSSTPEWTPLWPAMTRVLVMASDLENIHDATFDSLDFTAEGSVAQGLVGAFSIRGRPLC